LLDEMPSDNGTLIELFKQETTHVPILQTIPDESQRSPIQRVAVAVNEQRDIAFINAIVNAVNAGHDVAFCAHHWHIRPMRRAIERLGGTLLAS
jgi:hypothetical protein